MSARILKPCVERRGATCSKTSRLDHEKAAQRIGDLDAEQPAHKADGDLAGLEPVAGKPIQLGRGGQAARADDDIGVVLLEGLEHIEQQRLVVLQVGIHDGEVRRLGRQHSLDAGPGQSAPAQPADATDMRVLRADLPRLRRGIVWKIVVDENDLPADVDKRAVEALDQDRDVGAFIERRNDDREIGDVRSRGRRAGLGRDLR